MHPSPLDVIGLVVTAGEMQTFVSKSTNRELKKRELKFIDNSMYMVTLTLWGQEV